MNYIFQKITKFVKHYKSETFYFDVNDLGIQIYTIKLTYKKKIVPENFITLNEEKYGIYNYYEKVELPEVLLYGVKVWENFENYNNIHINSIMLKKNSNLLIKKFRDEYSPNDRENLFNCDFE